MDGSRNNPSTNAVLRVVRECLSRHVRRNESIVVGFSGGLDSTALLHAANCLALADAWQLSALHVHHGLSANADVWVESCRNICDQLGVPLEVIKVDVPRQSPEGIEGAARRLRHRVMADFSSDWILLGHHADDQAETLLHNLLRGTGVRGAAAMQEARDNVLRPLLTIDRAELAEYANSCGLVWIEDESNLDFRFTRNFLRAKVLPVIAERFPKANHQLAAAANRFGEAELLLETLATLDLHGHPPEFPLPMSLIRDLAEARARNLLRAMLAWSNAQAPDESRLREFVRQLRTAANDRRPRLDIHSYSLWCEAGKLFFEART